MNLPEKFLKHMEELLGAEEGKIFFDSYQKTPLEGIRYNSLKMGKEDFQEKVSRRKALGDPIPWCPTGYYYHKEENKERLSIHPWYHTGLYYFQEPSAMYPVELLDPKPGDRVLDLCAAPGGKSTQIAMKMKNQGLLVANEINPKRSKALLKNIELYGITNTIVTNSTGKHLLETYGSYFDKVLIDAPCSGEGTFRRDKRSVREYENFANDRLLDIQKDILDYGAKLLAVGGEMVYSTCTFNPEENEAAITYLLNQHDFEILKTQKIAGMQDGRPEWISGSPKELVRGVRFWPHHCKGEGHFAIHLRKISGKDFRPERKPGSWFQQNKLNPQILTFLADWLNTLPHGVFYEHGGRVFTMKEAFPYSVQNKLETVGLKLGELGPYGFTPAQSLILSLKPRDIKHIIEVSEEEANRYIKGETLNRSLPDGYYGVVFDGLNLGWAKVAGGFFKNLYPKNWRKSY